MLITKEIRKALAIPKAILTTKIVRKLIGKSDFLKVKRLDVNLPNTLKLNLPNQYKLPSLELLSKFEGPILELGNHFLKNEFNLLGSGWVEVSKKTIKNTDDVKSIIDWNLDFISGYIWDNSELSKDLKYGNIHGVDVKVPWELGRMQFLPLLIYSASIENSKNNWNERDKFLIKFQSTILDFINSNPVGFGIQWKSPMDASIRLINILVALDLSKSFHDIFEDEFFEMLNKTISDHTKFILNNLEWNDGLRGNHYLFNLAALIFSACYTEQYETSSILLKSTIIEFYKEVDYQFNEDGSNFEASIPYHFFTSELLFHTLNLLENNNHLKLTDKLKSKISKIYIFCNEIILPNGNIEQIGDNDSGCFLKLLPLEQICEEYLFKQHVLSLIKNQHASTDKYLSDEFYNSILTTRLPLKSVYHSSHSDGITLNEFTDFGIYLYRSNELSLQIRCGSVGQMGKGGHAHNDQLSFTLFYKGYTFITDPGTFCYTSDRSLRNIFRSTEYHNTVCISGKEQNEIWSKTSDDMFWLIDQAKSRVIKINDHNFQGEHRGFGRVYNRTFVLSNEIIEVTESIELKDRKILHLHLHPDIKIESSENEIKLSQNDLSICLDIGGSEYSIEEYQYSPAYGVKKNSKRIKILIDSNNYKWTIKL